MPRPPRRLAVALALAFAAIANGADDPHAGRLADQAALKPFGDLVGTWRGTGQAQRNSTKGAWRETADWAWKLDANSAGLRMKVEDGKYLRSAVLHPVRGTDRFALDAVLADGSTHHFVGEADSGGKLALTTEGPTSNDAPRRITITPLHGTRVLILLEGQVADSGRFFRLGEVGYTREGISFAAGDSYPECIVTGGRGTTEVKYQGKSYWVCCSGCKDLFEDDPAAILAEAAEKRKAKRGK